jgi:hypothetical protein
MKKVAVVGFLLLASVGCANPFSKYYTDKLNGRPIEECPDLIPAEGKPTVTVVGDIHAANLDMLENGYRMIGFSTFQSSAVELKKAWHQAKAVHAEVVLVKSRYDHTEQGTVAVTTTQAVNTQFSGSYSGLYSGGTYYGSATTYVPTTHYFPYSVDKFDYVASYWVKSMPGPFGAYFNDLTQQQRQALGRNRGVCITVVRKGSPAFNADILRGDLLLKIDGQEVIDVPSVIAVLHEKAGQPVDLTLNRNGSTIQKKVGLNPLSY